MMKVVIILVILLVISLSAY
ncbi:type I toxin-antitoxin system Ibs family toxin [Salmonella enterica]|uniref:Type I toxin-antitoxin system Ibs family toxin n=1 Tax=Salmonella enterica TaxID=28901 RepID=A0A5Y7WL02_SALER|nr:type I toxin-antitoxin system Ibs family toxin [Salmonella enterica]ECA1972494.1 type I toxin-antitoxin system Ibs family toxin [Salmonella enterica subsp. enterica serovar Colorado]ECU7658062.1 type I toxin-antitoxin system Ibs family toxin [Salmonella enterica subsp. enterica serovar Bassadji]EBA9357922.1 type I toxin-antitoxin system Ibs family toxin [Salmonella enterica]ECQ3075680.1 type I toxin-antitoxin system Ibs family toxin [Salmonella enterica]